MLNELINVVKAVWRLLVWWFVVLPWEEALRVRGGKARRRYTAGLHFRVPYYDQVFKQSTRLRWTSIPPQTLTTRDGAAVTLAGQIGYSIADLDKLYDTLQQGESAVQSIAAGAVARHIVRLDRSECTLDKIEAGCTLDLSRYGLTAGALQLTTFAFVKTLRIINDSHPHIWEDYLDTRNDADTAKKA